MATKSIGCDSVRIAQANELEKQGLELMHTGEALKLSQSESKTLQGLLTNEKEGRALDGRQSELDKSVLKDKVKRRNKVIAIESIGIILLLLL